MLPSTSRYHHHAISEAPKQHTSRKHKASPNSLSLEPSLARPTDYTAAAGQLKAKAALLEMHTHATVRLGPVLAACGQVNATLVAKAQSLRDQLLGEVARSVQDCASRVHAALSNAAARLDKEPQSAKELVDLNDFQRIFE